MTHFLSLRAFRASKPSAVSRWRVAAGREGRMRTRPGPGKRAARRPRLGVAHVKKLSSSAGSSTEPNLMTRVEEWGRQGEPLVDPLFCAKSDLRHMGAHCARHRVFLF